jgi:orotate phosphoribosyltransferase
MFSSPSDLQPLVRQLADRLAAYQPAVICGPMNGGAFLAQILALDMKAQFCFAERRVTNRSGMFPVDYRIPDALRDSVRNKPVAVVDDAISAGSALHSTLQDLRQCQAEPLVVAALMVIGERAEEMAKTEHLPLESLRKLAEPLYLPSDCPLCARGQPITEP